MGRGTILADQTFSTPVDNEISLSAIKEIFFNQISLVVENQDKKAMC
jgi:hypothetical protein